MGKEAVVFILDTHPSMNAAYPTRPESSSHKSSQNSGCTTIGSRLSCAKNVIEYMISDLMIQSKTNEVGVIVLKTKETDHHMIPQALKKELAENETQDDVPFPNVTELSSSPIHGVGKPTIRLLRRIGKIQSTVTDEVAETLRGDFCDGIIVAADALYQRTFGKKYERRIVLFTDAKHNVMVDINQILIVIDALRSMQCKLQVIGLDFTTTSRHFHQPLQPEPVISSSSMNNNKKAKIENIEEGFPKDIIEDDGDNEEQEQEQAQFGGQVETPLMKNEFDKEDRQEEKGDEKDEEECNNDDDNYMHSYSTKEDREQLLISLTEKTGGNVLSATSIQQILETTLGKKIIKAVRRKIQFRIATPGITGLCFDNVRYSLLQKKCSMPRLKKEAVLLDTNNNNNNITTNSIDVRNNNIHTNTPLLNSLGEEMTKKVVYNTSYWHTPTSTTSTTYYNKHTNGNNNNANTNHTANNSIFEEEPMSIELQPSDRTKAVRYGSDIIPIGKLDLDGLKRINSQNNNNNSKHNSRSNTGDNNNNNKSTRTTNNNDPHIQILGYMDRGRIPQTLFMGPPYAIYSDEITPPKNKNDAKKQSMNKRTAAAISSLAQALYNLDRIAICTFVKSRGSDPILGGIFPLLMPATQQQQQERSTTHRPPTRLVFLQLPFAGDVKRFSMKPLDDYIIETDNNDNNNDNKNNNNNNTELAKCTDDLIFALLLPNNVLCNEQIPNPFLRSYHKTIVKRALDPKSKTIVSVRSEDEDTGMKTPSNILDSAKPTLERFRKIFPHRVQKIMDEKEDDNNNSGGGLYNFKGKKKKNQLTFRDFL